MNISEITYEISQSDGKKPKTTSVIKELHSTLETNHSNLKNDLKKTKNEINIKVSKITKIDNKREKNLKTEITKSNNIMHQKINPIYLKSKAPFENILFKNKNEKALAIFTLSK